MQRPKWTLARAAKWCTHAVKDDLAIARPAIVIDRSIRCTVTLAPWRCP